jgi:hypothetical protein
MSYAISVKIFFLKLIGSYAEAFLYNKVCLNVVRPSYSRSYGSLRHIVLYFLITLAYVYILKIEDWKDNS